MMGSLAADPMSADPLTRQLREVIDRLCREFAPAGGAADVLVRRHVAQVRAGFGTPAVVIYLPVLVEREVRHRLAVRTPAGQQATSVRG